MKRLPAVLRALLLAATSALLGCERQTGAGTNASSPDRDARPLVVCTTTMITDLAHQLGGERVRVVGLLPPKTDPHIYEPTPDDSVLFRKAALVLYNGLHLEGKMVHMFEGTRAKAVALAEDPRIRPRESAGAKGAPDPHCWWDARHFVVYAEKTRDALIGIDPPGEADYRRRAEEYIAQLSTLDNEIRVQIAAIPAGRRILITSHDAFYYYGAAYGLEVDAVLGISTDASVTANRINELANLVVSRRIPAIFHETSVSASLNEMVNRVVELAARRGHTVRIPTEPLYSDSLDEPGQPAGTYLGALRENTRIIVTALSAPPASMDDAGTSP